MQNDRKGIEEHRPLKFHFPRKAKRTLENKNQLFKLWNLPQCYNNLRVYSRKQ